MLVRCLRGSRPAAALPRPSLGVASDRASTGRLAAALVWGRGVWLALGVDEGFCVRALRVQRFCVCYGIPSPTQKRSASTRECSIVAVVCRGESHDSSFSWTGPREGRILPRSRPSAVDLPPDAGSEGGGSTARTRLRRTLAQERRQEGSCVAREPRPDHETRNHPQTRRRSRPSRKPDPVKAEAAHQQGHDPCRQRTSKVPTTTGSTPSGPRHSAATTGQNAPKEPLSSTLAGAGAVRPALVGGCSATDPPPRSLAAESPYALSR